MRQLLRSLLKKMTGPSYEDELKNASPTIVVKDRYGNTLEICKKCKVPARIQCGIFKCINGCIFGHLDYMPIKDPSKSNSYNPLKLVHCQSCYGDGKDYFKEDGEWCVKPCDTCQGKGSFQVKKYSETEEAALSQPLPLDVDDEGWTRCPRCNFRFMVKDPNVWLEDRHRRCSQKLVYNAQ